MIKLQDLSPAVYYNQSRDFQFIGRLYDIVLNSVKTNADLLKNLPVSYNSDSQLADLMAMSLGFKSKHNYNVRQLTALCSAFCEIMRYKGSIKAIQLALDTLVNAEGITQPASCELDGEAHTVKVFLPYELTDLNLFRDLLVYILPAGMTCDLARISDLGEEIPGTELEINETINYGNSKYFTGIEMDNIGSIMASTETILGETGGMTSIPNIFTSAQVTKPESIRAQEPTTDNNNTEESTDDASSDATP